MIGRREQAEPLAGGAVEDLGLDPPPGFALNLGAAVRNVTLMAVLALTTAAIIYSLFGSVMLMTAMSMSVAYAVVVGGARVGLVCALAVFGMLIVMPRDPAWLAGLGGGDGQALIIEVLACVVVVLLAIAVELRRQVGIGLRASLDRQRRQAELVQAVLDGLGPQMFVSLLRPDGTILEVNRSVVEVFGKARERLLGQRIEAPGWLDGEDMRERVAAATRAAAAGETRRLDLRVCTAKGTMWVDCSIGPLFDQAGRLRYLVTSALDITQRRQAERTQQATFDAVPTALLLVGRDGRIAKLNKQASQLLGYSVETLTGASLERLLPESARDHHQGLLEGYFEQPSSRIMGGGRDLVAVRADRSTVPVEIGLNPLPLEHGEYVIAAIADISDRRAAQRTLEEAASRLEAEVAERTEQLQVSNVRWRQRSARLQALGRMLDHLPGCRDESQLAEVVATYLPEIYADSSGLVCIEAEGKHGTHAQWGTAIPALQDRAPDGLPSRSAEPRRWRMGGGMSAPMVFYAPISSGEGHLGWLECRMPMTAEDEAGGEGEEAEFLLGRVSHNLGMAITNMRLRRTLEAQATSDALTQLFNRRYLDTVGVRMVAEAQRHARPLAVLTADVDCFKDINDTHGHEAGDRVLCELAEIMRAQLRASDLPCRYGGEEFVILLPDTDQDAALECAERIRAAVAEARLEPSQEPITVSLGVAIQPNDGEVLRELIAAADEAMYRAKREGRNRVERASSLGA
jgi:diguanylate cyclase (GGDEF)-like protein/PAS domain S-box-containing protein